MKPIITPHLVFEAIHRPNPMLLGSKIERDAFADDMLAREREYEATMKGLPDVLPISAEQSKGEKKSL